MTFGIGVDREQAYPAVLERELARLRARAVEVVNAGVCCWGQQEEIAFLEHRAPSLEPDFVVLQFTVANDVLDNLRYRSVDGGLVPDPELGMDLSQHPIFEVPVLASSSRLYRLLLWNVGRHIVRYRAMVEPWRLERTGALLRRARDLAHRRGIGLALLVTPTVVQVKRSRVEWMLRTKRINDAIAAQAERDGIPVWKPLSLLRKAHAAGKDTYFPIDMHWNVEGHALVGRELASWLGERLPR
jgi:hypothetical protein